MKIKLESNRDEAINDISNGFRELALAAKELSNLADDFVAGTEEGTKDGDLANTLLYDTYDIIDYIDEMYTKFKTLTGVK